MSGLLGGGSPPFGQALVALQEQLAALAARADDDVATDAMLDAFQAFADTTLRLAIPDAATGGADARARFAAATASLQTRLADVNAAACADVRTRFADQGPTLHELFDAWVVAFERHFFTQLTDAEFGALFGDAVNAALECHAVVAPGKPAHDQRKET